MSRKKHKSRSSKKGVRSRQKGSGKWLYVVIPILAAVLIGVGGGWFLARRGDASSTGTEIQLAPVSQLPEKVRRAPPVVQEAYRFAIANPEVLAKLPCYCGCGSMGHESDLDCFIQEFKPDGTIVFGYHAYE
jgi:hypothetical protein